MRRFFCGDELGTVKSIRFTAGEDRKEWKTDTFVLAEGGSGGKPRGIQKLAVFPVDSEILLASACADGSASLLKVNDAASPSIVHEWKETRLKDGQRYIGLSVTQRCVYSCTTNGALRLTEFGEDNSALSTNIASLPMRLADWHLSPGGETFAYGGDEVELSVWNTEMTFGLQPESNSSSETKKRKRGDQLLPGEIWRAKNVPNDGLSLRQPVNNTSLAYLQPASSTSHCHVLAGTQQGNVRRYDTRAARRPVADWKGVAKIGGISTVENGYDEYEAFVADHGCNLFALDLRNGRVSYGYKGLAGSVVSMAPSPSFLTSVSQDRFLRLHSTFPPPAQAGSQQEQKGSVLDKQFMHTRPTVIVWDQITDHLVGRAPEDSDIEEGADDDVWDAMQNVEDVDDEEEGGKRRKKGKHSRIAP